MKKVFISVGHGGIDSGAVAGDAKEKDINLAVALATRDELVRHGVEVVMSRDKDEDDPLKEEIKECNAAAPDCAVSIHTNAGKGKGFEAFHSIGNEGGRALAELMEREIKLCGQSSRGCKTRAQKNGKDYYGFIRETKCTAVIVETGFMDNPKDLELFDEPAEQAMFGRAYAKGILSYLGVETLPAEQRKEYIVQAGVFRQKSNAEDYTKQLKKKGFEAIIIEKLSNN